MSAQVKVYELSLRISKAKKKHKAVLLNHPGKPTATADLITSPKLKFGVVSLS